VVGAFFGCHEFAFVQYAFSPGLSFIIQGSMANVAGDETWANPHNMGAGMQQFGAQGFQPALEGKFRGGISAAAGQTAVACDGGYTYDGAFSFQDGGEGVFRAVDGSEEVDLHDFTGHVGDGVEEEGPHADTGIIDEDVDASEGFDRGFDETAAFLFVADVAGDGMEEDAGVFDLEFIDLIVIATAGSDPGAQGYKSFDQRFAYAIAAACDYYYFILVKRHIYGLWLQTYELWMIKYKIGE
jgi:hypothetical protein